jgi:hypothetical protein
MNPIQQLRLHIEALAAAVSANEKFFASVVHYVARFRQLLSGRSADLTQEELSVLSRKLEEFWGKWRPTGGGGLYLPPRETADTDSAVREVGALVSGLALLDRDAFMRFAAVIDPPGIPVPLSAPDAVRPPCVFLGHGGSRLWARVKMFLEEELGLATVTYESEPRTGESIVPVLERMLEQATFAVLVLTAEDEVSGRVKRARQNVIHEAGLFQGRLGFKRAVILMQEGTESFTNVAGLQHIPFTGEKIEQAFYDLNRVLAREGQVRGPSAVDHSGA